MKKILFISAAVLGLTVAQGQTNVYHTFPDSNAIWNFHFQLYCFANGTADEYYSITYSGDTIINSQTYQKLITPYVQSFSTGTCGNYPTGYKGAIRQDISARKVYFVPPSNSTEQLLYDFTMQVGDTVRGYLEAFTFPYDIVQSIDSVLVGSTYRKRWNINNCYNIHFIEGIGSTYGLFQQSPGCITDQADFTLTCFQQNGQTLYSNTTSNCQLITSINSVDNYSNKISISPNPFSTSTTLHTDNLFHNATLTVYNSFGEKVKQIKNISVKEIKLFRDNLPSGLYFIRLTEGNKIFPEKLVITDM